MGLYMSHFCCELAESELQDGNTESARKYLRQARRLDPGSVRARLVLAKIARHKQAFDEAMDMGATEGATALSPVRPVTYGWSAGDTLLTVTPDAALDDAGTNESACSPNADPSASTGGGARSAACDHAPGY